jgi:hypothetical protein
MPPLTEAWTPLRPVQEQSDAWRTKARYVAIPAGRGSGKTELARRRLVRYLQVIKDHPDPRYFYGAPTQAQAMRVSWKQLLALIPKDWLAPETKQGEIITKFGSTLHVIGLDKPQRIEGLQFDGCVLDESSDLKPGTFDKTVVPMLTHRNGWCWRIGVPKRQGPGAKEYRKFFEEGLELMKTDSSRASYTWPSSKVLSPAQLKWAQENLDPKDYREQFEARWENAGGSIFYAFDREYNVRPCHYRPEKTIIVGSDFNVDPMAWTIGHAWEDRIEWFDEIWLRDTNTDAALKVLVNRYSDHRAGFEFYGDASAKARKTSASTSDYNQILLNEALKELGRTIHYPAANPPVSSRIAACNAMFCNAHGDCRMFIDPKCTRLIDDLEARYYAPGTCDPADTGDLGHITDAMGYAVLRLFPIRIPIEIPMGEIATTR